MSKITTIMVPAIGPNKKEVLVERSGQVAVFQIGGQKIKFFIQSCGLKGEQLTHWASGQTVVNTTGINAIKVRSMHGGTVYTTREACRQALGKIEAQMGAAAMLVKFATAKVVNK